MLWGGAGSIVSRLATPKGIVLSAYGYGTVYVRYPGPRSPYVVVDNINDPRAALYIYASIKNIGDYGCISFRLVRDAT